MSRTVSIKISDDVEQQIERVISEEYEFFKQMGWDISKEAIQGVAWEIYLTELGSGEVEEPKDFLSFAILCVLTKRRPNKFPRDVVEEGKKECGYYWREY